jgi:hypothetical protein
MPMEQAFRHCEMEQAFRHCDKDTLKMAMLKHEETFRQQVSSKA